MIETKPMPPGWFRDQLAERVCDEPLERTPINPYHIRRP